MCCRAPTWFVTAGLVLAVTGPARGITYTWTATTGGTFQTPGNWSPSGPPGTSDTALFNADATYTVGFSGNTATTAYTQPQGAVTLDVGAGHTYSVSGPNGFTVGGVNGQTANLTLNSGTLRLANPNEGPPTGGIGVVAGSTGSLTVTGAGTALIGIYWCDVGVAGTGTLTVQNGATATMAQTPYVGYLAGSHGSVVVGAGGTFAAPEAIVVGQQGIGSIAVNGGGSATLGAVNAGQIAGASGSLTVGDGTGPATLTVTNANNYTVSVGVGISGTGVLTVNAGGTLNAAGNASVANATGSTGTVTVAGAWNQSGGSIYIGGQTVGTPGGTGSVTINSGGSLTVTGGIGITTFAGHGTLTINSGGTVTAPTMTNNGALNLQGTVTTTSGLTNAGVLTAGGTATNVYGPVQNATGGQILNNGVLTFHDAVVNNGTEIRTAACGRTVVLAVASGAGPYTGPGTVEFDADVRPGNSAARVTFAGDLAFGSLATLHVELGGTTAGTQYDQLAVTGTASLTGALDVVLINGFAPQPGQQFDVLTYGSHAGDFTSFTGLDLGNGLALTPVASPTAYSLVVTPVPEPGTLALVGLAMVCATRQRHRRA